MKVTDKAVTGEHNGVSSYTTPTMAIREVRDYTQNIVGKVLTIVDASIADQKQRKAIKDLIHNAIWSQAYTDMISHADFLVREYGKGPYPEIGYVNNPPDNGIVED
jgi:hypothetical protein